MSKSTHTQASTNALVVANDRTLATSSEDVDPPPTTHTRTKKTLFGSIGLLVALLVGGAYAAPHLTRANNQAPLSASALSSAATATGAEGSTEQEFIPTVATISIVDNGLTLHAHTTATTVGEALAELEIELTQHDRSLPKSETPIAHGGTIIVERAKQLTIENGETSQSVRSHMHTVQDLLQEHSITLNEDDYVEPGLHERLPETGTIRLVRVTKETITEEEAIPFERIVTEDASLKKGVRIVDQAGSEGEKERELEITQENGEEVERVVLTETILSEPVTERIRVGTKEEPKPTPPNDGGGGSGAVQTGRATYYWGPTAAASTTLPKGTRVRVTNTNTGKSLVVTIDDTGGFTYPTVIDLRSDLFEQLGAPLSAGIMPVRVEVL